MTPDLLPPSATPTERKLSRTMALDRRLPEVERVTGGKLVPLPRFLPWLLWEYALGEVLEYLTEPERALREGVAWQRLRGTPAGLRMAYSWRGWQDVAIEEGVPGSARFAEFQVDPGVVLRSGGVDDLLGLSRLSAPARSRLARIFHGYDLRRLRLDVGRLDHGLLSDFSGIHDPRGVRLSFGRRTPAEAANRDMVAELGRHRLHGGWVALRNRLMLDVGFLDLDRHLRIPHIQHVRLLTQSNDPVSGQQRPIKPRRFARAMVILSDGRPLDGEVNNRTSPRWAVQHGERLRLSAGGARLSAYRNRVEYVPLYEVWLGRHAFSTSQPYGGPEAVAVLRHGQRPVEAHPTKGFPILSQPGWYRVPSSSGVGSVLSETAAYSGQFWTGTNWPAATWRDVREVVSATHTTTPI